MTEVPRPANPALRRLYRGLLRAYYYCLLADAHLFLTRNARTCVILAYHGVTATPSPAKRFSSKMFVPLQRFESQLDFLQRRCTVLSLSEAVARLQRRSPFPPRSVVLTFDDGYMNNASEVFPLLQERQLPFTIFPTTQMIGGGRAAWWHRLESGLDNTQQKDTVALRASNQVGEFDLGNAAGRRKLFEWTQNLILGAPSEEEEIMACIGRGLGSAQAVDKDSAFVGWDELKRMLESPLVEVGAHTNTHPNLVQLDGEHARQEILGSKSKLEAMLGRKVTSFAYPFGQPGTYDEGTIAVVKEAGFSCALTAIEGKVRANADLFQLPRVPILGDDTHPIFVGKLLGVSSSYRSLWRKVTGRPVPPPTYER